MFSKGVVLIFLLLGLSSSIAHAFPHQNRAPDPCEDTPQTSPAILVAAPSPSKVSPKTATDKGSGLSKSGNTTVGGKKGSSTTLTGKKGANPQENGKNGTTVNDNGKNGTSVNDNGKNGTSVNDNGKNGTSVNDNGKNGTSVNNNGNKGANPQTDLGSDNKNGTGNNNDPNTSLCLDQSVIATGSASDGLKNATAGTSASLTSTNNFINFCKTTGKTITNGQQIKDGSCNPIPMGVIASSQNIPSCKYVSPKNLDTLQANTAFTMKLAVKNIQLGVFTNADSNYYGAPQQVNKQGQIIGHTHLVVEKVPSISSTVPLDPTTFAFFKGIDNPAGADGTVSADVTAGLPEGVFRFSTITTSANHVPGLVAVAQHGTMEDTIYATVTADGKPSTGNNPATDNNNNNTTSVDTNSTTTAGKGDKTTPVGKGDKTTPTGKGDTTPTSKGDKTTPTSKGDKTTPTGKGGKTADKVPGGDKSPAAPLPSSSKKPRAFSLEYRKD